MTGAPSMVAGLLAECESHGVRLLLADDGGLTIDAPEKALTAALIERLKISKPDLVALLSGNTHRRGNIDALKCRCGSTQWRDIPIHGGRSIRRDCAACKRFLEFAVWYGKNAGPKGQYRVG